MVIFKGLSLTIRTITRPLTGILRMKELKHLNKYFKKYWSKLVIGILITMIARIFQLVMPSYVNKSISIVEDYFDGNIAEALAKKTLLTYILIILGAALYHRWTYHSWDSLLFIVVHSTAITNNL